MNAPLPPDAVAVASLPVAEIVPSPSNPRKHFDETYIAELAESIKAHGLIQPITVRPLPLDAILQYNKRRKHDDDSHPRYEIIVGECRWRAAQQAGLTEIPGFWRELDDKQVLELQVIENLQRRDVHEIEEAEGYEALMKRHGYTADEIAAKIGKSRGYVYARLKLTALCEEARTAFFDDKLDASTALLIARIPGATLQKRAVKEVTCGYDGEPLSYRNAKNHIQHHFTISLKQATFPLDDAALVPAAGSCADCPKRSGNAPDLCADLKDEDVCTDTQCFDEKRLARRAQLVAHAEQLKIPVITGPEAWQAYSDEMRLNPDDVVEGDGQERTYREILGDALPKPAALVEIGHHQREHMVELVDATAMAKALQKAGWTPDLFKDKDGEKAAQQDPAELQRRQEERAAEAAQMEAKEKAAEAENAWRKKLTEALAERLKTASDGSLNTDPIVIALAIAWLRQETNYVELPEDTLNQWGIELPAEYDEADELERICADMVKWPVGKALAFLFTALCAHEDEVSKWDFNPEKSKPHSMLAIAEAIDFNPETLREPASTPTTAAQAPVDATAAAPADAKGKRGGARKAKAKTDPAPAAPANEPPAAAETPAAGLGDWPFPTRKEAA